MRDNYWSFLKGIAIISVVFIHTPFESGNEFAGIALRQVVTFPVAFFIFLSGFFVKNDSLTWKGIKRLLIPYFIWTVLWLSETTITGSIPITSWKIINSLLLGGAFFPLYFLVVLMQLKLISSFLFRRIQAENYKIYKDWVWLVTPIWLLFIYVYQIKTGEQPLVYAQVFPAWLLFYYLGLYVGNRFRNGVKIAKHSCLTIGLLASLYLCIAEAEWLYDVINVPFFAASQIKVSSFIYSVFICLLSVGLYSEQKSNLICRIGDVSFGIFIIHIPVKMGVEIVASKMPLAFQSGIINQLIVVASTVLLSYMVIVVANRVLPNNIVMYLGLSKC